MWILPLLLLTWTPLPGSSFSSTSRFTSRHVSFLEAATEAPEVVESTEPAIAAANDIIRSDKDCDAFQVLAHRASSCILESDLRRDSIGKEANPSSATNFLNDASAFALQKTFDKLELKLVDERVGMDRDEASTWLRWMKSTPTSLVIDLSEDLRPLVNETISDENLETIGLRRTEFQARFACRLILLPSGASLKEPLSEPPASVVYGKLLYGGVTRYRLLSSSNSNRPPRRAGERLETKAAVTESIPVWLQYGGPDRNYNAVDMGAAAVLEIILLPRGQTLSSPTGNDMTLSRIAWKPQKMFAFVDADKETANKEEELTLLGSLPSALSGTSRNEAFKNDFQSSVGGLNQQIDSIVRRVLDGRVIRPAEVVDASDQDEDETTAELASAASDAEELALLGLTPVRGLLLYGPPGCGKTALAREISRALRAREPKVVSAPELLDRWVGGSERLVRGLFADAEAELAACEGDATKSALHVVVIDEIDAVFRKRSAGEDSGEATRASAVNQILAKLDGVNAIPNVLMIGMTNRRELLDIALLRPGRLEVQIEIPLPTREGRREILNIHFDALRQRGRLSMPLCCAIEGVASADELDADMRQRSASQGTSRLGRIANRLLPSAAKTFDLAATPTAGFSGADIAGLVRCAGSLSLSRSRKDGSGVDGLLITLDDVREALKEVKQ